MPIVFMPSNEVLVGLGKLVLQFAELEYWVNIGIIEAEHIPDTIEQGRITGLQFSKRVDRLAKALADAETRGWIQFGKDFVPSVDFDFLSQLVTVANDRNDILHGTTFTLLTKSAPFETRHRKVNPKSGRVHNLDKTTLELLTERIRDYAERLQYAVLDLCLAKNAKGIGSLTWG